MRPFGNCRLCGIFCALTFEHVPPRSAFNKHTRYFNVPFIDLLQRPNLLDLKVKGKPEQGGVGYYSLCNTCNNFLANNYVDAFTAYSNSFIELAHKKDVRSYEMVMQHFEAGRVLKAIVSMFLSMNDWEFSLANRKLAEYVMNPCSTDLPPEYRIFVYINSEGQLRNIPFMVKGNFYTKVIIPATEIAFPPLGHVMTIGFDGTIPDLWEITGFKHSSCDEKVPARFKIHKLPTHIPILLDYRSKDEISVAMNQK